MTRIPNIDYETPRDRPSNPLGIAGFIFSLIGLIACGTLAPIGLGLRAFAIRREPRGMAIAGLVIGIFGTIELLAIVGFWVFAIVFATRTGGFVGNTMKTIGTIQAADFQIQAYYSRHASTVPSDADGTAALTDNDAWGHPLQYHQLSPTQFEIRSPGADGILATHDDLTETFEVFPVTPPATAPAPESVPEPEK